MFMCWIPFSLPSTPLTHYIRSRVAKFEMRVGGKAPFKFKYAMLNVHSFFTLNSLILTMSRVGLQISKNLRAQLYMCERPLRRYSQNCVLPYTEALFQFSNRLVVINFFIIFPTNRCSSKLQAFYCFNLNLQTLTDKILNTMAEMNIRLKVLLPLWLFFLCSCSNQSGMFNFTIFFDKSVSLMCSA